MVNLQIKNVGQYCLIALAVGACTWCEDTQYASRYSEAAFLGLQLGETKSHVVAAIGEPLEKTSTSNRELWHYSKQGGNPRANYYIRIVVFSPDGTLAGKKMYLETD